MPAVSVSWKDRFPNIQSVLRWLWKEKREPRKLGQGGKHEDTIFKDSECNQECHHSCVELFSNHSRRFGAASAVESESSSVFRGRRIPARLLFGAKPSGVLIQNARDIKRTLFNLTKQDRTCEFSRKSSFSRYVQHKNRKTNN